MAQTGHRHTNRLVHVRGAPAARVYTHARTHTRTQQSNRAIVKSTIAIKGHSGSTNSV